METNAAGNATGEAKIEAPTSPTTTPIVLRIRKNFGVGATTLCARVNSTFEGILIFFIMNRIIKDSFKLFHFGFKLSNPLVNELQAAFKFALDEQSSRLDLG